MERSQNAGSSRLCVVTTLLAGSNLVWFFSFYSSHFHVGVPSFGNLHPTNEAMDENSVDPDEGHLVETLPDLHPSGTMVNGSLHYELSMCTTVKNAESLLRPWIEFHLLVGVEHFFMWDDNSSDRTLALMQEYEARGVLTVLGGSEAWRTQRNAINSYITNCFIHVAPRTNWMITIDVDEYLFPIDEPEAGPAACSLLEYIQKHSNPLLSHIMVRWTMFGSNGFQLTPHGSPPETHFWSGGDCSVLNKKGYDNPCAVAAYCGECSHTKYISNTGRCLRHPRHGQDGSSEHFPIEPNVGIPGMPQCEAAYTLKFDNEVRSRLSDSPEYCREAWRAAPHQGRLAVDLHSDAERPLMMPRPKSQSSHLCPGGGLALHHYAVLSVEAQRARAKRGARVRNWASEDLPPKRELNYWLTTNALRFVRALRAKLVQHGAEISPDLSFSDIRPGLACAVHRNLKVEGGTLLGLGAAPNGEHQCCKACTENPKCYVWTWSLLDRSCMLLKQAKKDRLVRKTNSAYISGFVVVNECGTGH